MHGYSGSKAGVVCGDSGALGVGRGGVEHWGAREFDCPRGTEVDEDIADGGDGTA